MRLAAATLALLGLTALSSTAVLAQRQQPMRDAVVNTGARQLVAPPAAAGPAGIPAARATGSRVVVDPTWLADVADRAGIPEPALRAYAAAQLSAPASCHLGWTTLAALGYIESQHGTIGGRTVGDDGRPSSPILGPALDGRGDVAAIRSTAASARFHGDPAWEHAVGPLQFLPSTWQTWGRDADGDGVADPADLDDAARAAAAYLCADGHDLSSGAGWTAAVLSYNHAMSYVHDVYDVAEAYAER